MESIKPMPFKGHAGYLYIIKDTDIQNLLKLGWSRDPVERLKTFNGTRPLDTCSFIRISKPVKRGQRIEGKVHSHIRMNYPDLHYNKEWYWDSGLKIYLELFDQVDAKTDIQIIL